MHWVKRLPEKASTSRPLRARIACGFLQVAINPQTRPDDLVQPGHVFPLRAKPGGVLERGLLLRLRFGLDLYINYRPFRGVAGSLADGCEFAIVRENTEGPYAGEGGILRRGTPQEVATQIRTKCEKVMREANVL